MVKIEAHQISCDPADGYELKLGLTGGSLFTISLTLPEAQILTEELTSIVPPPEGISVTAEAALLKKLEAAEKDIKELKTEMRLVHPMAEVAYQRTRNAH